MTELERIKSNRGFSMIELSMALGIMAVMAAFSIPMLSSSMRDMQLISDVRSVATSLTYAKLSAISKMTHYRVSFDLTDNQWGLEKETGRNTNEFEVQQAANSLSSGVSGSGIEFKSTSSTAPSGFPTDSSNVVTFNSRGIPIGGTQIVYLSKPDADFAVSVSLSGRVQIWRQSNNQWVAQ